MRYLSTVVLLSFLFTQQSCSSGSSGAAADQTAASVAVTAPSAPSADPAAKSESKGVGKFTSVTIDAPDSKLAKKGAALFQAKCVSCHALSDQKIIGPGLKGITAIRTPQWIMNMTYSPEDMVRKDPVAKALKEQYKLPMMIPGGITEDECRAVFEFLRANDQK
ncbi:c-type cytochrome [Arcticibacter tournemirensis]|nr:cytochrome c [Arcticibacter tournemirensis]